MAEPFKHLLNAPLMQAGAAHLRRAWPAFDAPAFVAIATRGLEDLERQARARQITDGGFAIRPFLIYQQALTLRSLAEWVHDPSAHVGRMVSEASCPRLQWGVQLEAFAADPSPTLALLRRGPPQSCTLASALRTLGALRLAQGDRTAGCVLLQEQRRLIDEVDGYAESVRAVAREAAEACA
jgi:hypothetical protein